MKKAIQTHFWITFFISPGLLIVSVFILLPLFLSLFNSLFSWNQLIRGTWVGLENFRRIFFTTPYKERFFNALQNNAKWFGVTMLIQNTLGLAFGYLLSRRVPGYGFFRRTFFIPVLFSIVAVGFLWGMYLKPNGLLNIFLTRLGLETYTRAWLGEEAIATFSIIAVNIWRWVGFPTLVFLAAIDAIPIDCMEAAYLDGAKELQVFRQIVLPLIVPSLTVITVLTLIGSLNVFEQIYTMTGLDGSPNYSTDTIGTLFYRTAFGSVDSGNPEIGIGSAIGVIIYLLTFLSSAVFIAFSRSKEVEL
ncbi:MAG: sugar ABC transporter permease [Spirochaetales bacterium]